jgi:hypothetical protein
MGWAVAELSAVRDPGGALELPQLGAELVRHRDDQDLELVDRGGGSEGRAVTGGKQHPQCLAFATEAGLDQMLGCQGLLGGPGGVEHVGLAASAVGRSFRAADLDDLLACLVQEDREVGECRGRLRAQPGCT